MKPVRLVVPCKIKLEPGIVPGTRITKIYPEETKIPELGVKFQQESLRRIFGAGLQRGAQVVSRNGNRNLVYMIAGRGFDFVGYGPHLQKLVDEKPELFNIPEVNAWTDIENDAYWVLSAEDYRLLDRVLCGIQLRWERD